MKRIFIDAGHGGSDPGATANGFKEKDICLAISLLIRSILNKKYSGHSAKLSRTTDQTLPLKERTNMANKWGAHYLLSIHINAGGGTGFESFTFNGKYTTKEKTTDLQNQIHHEMVKETMFRDRGKKEANFHMLRKSSMPALLTENSFIDNKTDARQLKSDVFLHKIAIGHVRGLAKALSLKQTSSQGKAGSHIHVVQQGDTLWQVAKENETTVDQLLELNQHIDPRRLQIGQKVIVNNRAGQYYTIKKRDTLWILARKYNTTVVKLLQLNKGIEPERLQIGQQIRIR